MSPYRRFGKPKLGFPRKLQDPSSVSDFRHGLNLKKIKRQRVPRMHFGDGLRVRVEERCCMRFSANAYLNGGLCEAPSNPTKPPTPPRKSVPGVTTCKFLSVEAQHSSPIRPHGLPGFICVCERGSSISMVPTSGSWLV